MHSILIRRGVVADASALAEFAARTFADTFAADNWPDDMHAHITPFYGVRQQTEELADPNVITLLASPQGVLVAYAQVRRGSPPDCVTQEQPIELHRFYVDRPAHGSGVASALMVAVHEAARELGGQHLWLGVWERNQRAIAFYAKMGFLPIGSHDFYVGPDRQTDRVFVMAVHRPNSRAA
jgi:ribosomal protein S18 acetylase RimI-like enzyme